MDPPTELGEQLEEDTSGLSKVSHLIGALVQTNAVTRRQAPIGQLAQEGEETYDPLLDYRRYEQYNTGTSRVDVTASGDTAANLDWEELYLIWYEHYHGLTPPEENQRD